MLQSHNTYCCNTFNSLAEKIKCERTCIYLLTIYTPLKSFMGRESTLSPAYSVVNGGSNLSARFLSGERLSALSKDVALSFQLRFVAQ